MLPELVLCWISLKSIILCLTSFKRSYFVCYQSDVCFILLEWGRNLRLFYIRLPLTGLISCLISLSWFCSAFNQSKDILNCVLLILTGLVLCLNILCKISDEQRELPLVLKYSNPCNCYFKFEAIMFLRHAIHLFKYEEHFAKFYHANKIEKIMILSCFVLFKNLCV